MTENLVTSSTYFLSSNGTSVMATFSYCMKDGFVDTSSITFNDFSIGRKPEGAELPIYLIFDQNGEFVKEIESKGHYEKKSVSEMRKSAAECLYESMNRPEYYDDFDQHIAIKSFCRLIRPVTV